MREVAEKVLSEDKIFQPLQTLIRRLKSIHVIPIIVSASNEILLKSVSEQFGVNPNHTHGMGFDVKQNYFTGIRVGNETYGQGKVDLIRKSYSDRNLALAAGDSSGDSNMFKMVRGDGVIIWAAQGHEGVPEVHSKVTVFEIRQPAPPQP